MSMLQQDVPATQPPANPDQSVLTPPSPLVIINGVPQTAAEMFSLREQREELSDQLVSAIRRRNDVAERLASAPEAERLGLEARLKLLDERILNIEGEIARTGELMAQAPGNLLSTRSSAPDIPGLRMNSGDITGVMVVFTIFVLFPIALTVSRLLWRRGLNPAPKKTDIEAEERMRRLENGVDAIAIEVERISEGQRFMTKLLSEREKQPVLRGDG